MSSAEEHVSLKTYFAVYVALLVLLVVTVAAGYFEAGWAAIYIAMAIATVKAVLILLYFMHVKFSSRLIAVFMGASVYFLIVGAVLMFNDYIFRSLQP